MSGRGSRTSAPQRLFYTVNELADLAQISKQRMRRMLKANDVPIGAGGARKGVVYVAALASSMPDLVDSIRMTGADHERTDHGPEDD